MGNTTSNERVEQIRKDLQRHCRPWYDTDIAYLLSLVPAASTASEKCVVTSDGEHRWSDASNGRFCDFCGVTADNEPQHAAHCAIWLPMIRSCDCGAVRVATPPPSQPGAFMTDAEWRSLSAISRRQLNEYVRMMEAKVTGDTFVGCPPERTMTDKELEESVFGVAEEGDKKEQL